MCQTLTSRGGSEQQEPQARLHPSPPPGGSEGLSGSTEPSLGAGVGVHEGLPRSPCQELASGARVRAKCVLGGGVGESKGGGACH